MYGLNKENKYLLACSYGPDSMALFDMLIKDGIYFEVAHVNYNLRKESKLETQSLIEYCSSKSIKIHTLEIKQKIGLNNVEAKCRVLRYNFFAKMIKGFDSLLVAHNQDDLIETYLIQKQRGNIVDFYGIKENAHIFGINVCRPLLKHKKSELLNYCVRNNIPYAIDSSNLEDKFLRNRIRHSIVEKMSDVERLLVLDEINLMNRKLKQTFDKIDGLDLSLVKDVISLNDKEFAMALNKYVRRYDQKAEISFRQAVEIKKAIKSKNPNIKFKINLNISLVKEYDRLKIIQNSPNESYAITLEKPCEYDCEYFYANFVNDSSDRNIKLTDYPIVIRNAQLNDEVIIKDYTKKVRRLFIDWKMPLELRKKWPVIINKDGKVIYIPRYRHDFKKTKDLNFYVK